MRRHWWLRERKESVVWDYVEDLEFQRLGYGAWGMVMRRLTSESCTWLGGIYLNGGLRQIESTNMLSDIQCMTYVRYGEEVLRQRSSINVDKIHINLLEILAARGIRKLKNENQSPLQFPYSCYVLRNISEHLIKRASKHSGSCERGPFHSRKLLTIEYFLF